MAASVLSVHRDQTILPNPDYSIDFLPLPLLHINESFIDFTRT